MTELRDTIHVHVEYFDGQAEGDEGIPYYVASCEEIAAITDGRTLDELFDNIRTMIDAHLEGEDTAALYHLVAAPRILVTVEMPYAKTA